MQYFKRKYLMQTSNNPENPRKNICGLAIAKILGVEEKTLYLHTWPDLKSAIGSLYGFRSVKTAVHCKKDSTVGSLRGKIEDHFKTHGDVVLYVVRVEGHVLALGPQGQTWVDTAKRKRDRRKVLDVYGVYLPVGNEKKLAEIAKRWGMDR